MRKKLLPIILVCCTLAALLAVGVTAADDIVASGNCGENVKWTLDNKGNLTISGTGAMYDYGRYGDSKESGTNTPWYNNREVITSLTVSNGITGIGTNAFWGLLRLSKVTLPDSIIRIKECAFGWCSSLTKIAFPDSVSSLEVGVLYGCSNLLSFTISDNVTHIGSSAFRECDRLTNLIIPPNVEYLDGKAFWRCDKLQSVTILGNIPMIKLYTFAECPALTQVTIPDSVLIMEENAFSGCTALKDVYFNGTESMWKNIAVDNGNELLDGVTIHTDTSASATYRINGITVSGGTEGLGAIPYGSFFATVSITNRASGTSPMICLAAYTENGKFQKFVYVTVKEPVGGTVEVTLPVDNSYMDIAELKAFAVSSFDFTPVGNVVSYPESNFLV